jgi:hypothetical protein
MKSIEIKTERHKQKVPIRTVLRNLLSSPLSKHTNASMIAHILFYELYTAGNQNMLAGYEQLIAVSCGLDTRKYK